MVPLDQPIKLYGSRQHRPVILSLPGEGGHRCSVKPASRYTLHSRSHDTHVFTRMPWLDSWLETGEPESNWSEPNLVGWINVPSPYSSHLGLQAYVTWLSWNAGGWMRVIMFWYYFFASDVGLLSLFFGSPSCLTLILHQITNEMGKSGQ